MITYVPKQPKSSCFLLIFIFWAILSGRAIRTRSQKRELKQLLLLARLHDNYRAGGSLSLLPPVRRARYRIAIFDKDKGVA